MQHWKFLPYSISLLFPKKGHLCVFYGRCPLNLIQKNIARNNYKKKYKYFRIKKLYKVGHEWKMGDKMNGPCVDEIACYWHEVSKIYQLLIGENFRRGKIII